MITASVHEIIVKSKELAETGRLFYLKGWSLATSSNYSARLSTGEILITSSGKEKNYLQPEDMIAVNLQGEPLQPQEPLKPSAETLLHCQIYRRIPTAMAVLHSHSKTATILSCKLAKEKQLQLTGYEMLKALEGNSTHEMSETIPILPNNQDIAALAAQVDTLMDQLPPFKAYLIAGHGLYTWATSIAACRRQVEALEFLLECELQRALVDKMK